VRDSEVAVDFFNARYLSSGLGRFISADPANAGMDFTNPQSMNGYGYVLGNPLGLVDPSGLGPTKIVPGNIGSVGPQGPNCFMDGLSTTCGLAADLVASGAAALCPNNVCSAFGTSSGGQIQYYQFSSYANGMTGYIPINSTPYEIQENVLGTVYTSDGIFLCCGPEASSLPPLNWLSLSYTTSGGASIQFNKTCVGDRGHGLAGNPSYVQQTPQGGAFAPWGVHPTAGTAAVIPSQWGYSNNVAMHGVISQISGTVGGNQFSSITDVIGSKVRPGVRDFFSRQAGGQLVIEIPGGRDTGPNAAVSVTVPAFPAGLPTANGCPSHTD
jgi:RHS repeat-associated protein